MVRHARMEEEEELCKLPSRPTRITGHDTIISRIGG